MRVAKKRKAKNGSRLSGVGSQNAKAMHNSAQATPVTRSARPGRRHVVSRTIPACYPELGLFRSSPSPNSETRNQCTILHKKLRWPELPPGRQAKSQAKQQQPVIRNWVRFAVHRHPNSKREASAQFCTRNSGCWSCGPAGTQVTSQTAAACYSELGLFRNSPSANSTLESRAQFAQRAPAARPVKSFRRRMPPEPLQVAILKRKHPSLLQRLRTGRYKMRGRRILIANQTHNFDHLYSRASSLCRCAGNTWPDPRPDHGRYWRGRFRSRSYMQKCCDERRDYRDQQRYGRLCPALSHSRQL